MPKEAYDAAFGNDAGALPDKEGTGTMNGPTSEHSQRHDRKFPNGTIDWDKRRPSCEWRQAWYRVATRWEVPHEGSRCADIARALALMIEAYESLVTEHEAERARRIRLLNARG